jgi:flagellar motility protein MotE (MotC chaperone)
VRETTSIVTRPAQTVQAQETARPKLSWAQEMFGYPDVTGSVGAKPAPKEAAAAPEQKSEKPKTIQKPVPKATTVGTPVQFDAAFISPAERALLERLSERRQELDKRQSELEMRDTLLKEAEKRLESRLNELKEAEARIVAATQHKEEAEVQRLKNLVTMYENMKAKDAAKIFDRLDLKLATDVAKLIQPRRMSDILAQMTPEAAERLTVELASRGHAENKAVKPAELPKIEGKPGS